ncbi:MAG: hypothetical protein OCC46_03475 [Pseudodesulfovibrio sp.]
MKAAPWPYMTGVASLLLACGLGLAGLIQWAENALPQAAALGWWGLCWLVVALFALADGISRHRECQRIKLMFLKFGYSKRILEPLAQSRCQRDAAIFAADEVGHGIEARVYFMELGYRWYHILPDSVRRNPLSFLRPRFVLSAFLPGKKARA